MYTNQKGLRITVPCEVLVSVMVSTKLNNSREEQRSSLGPAPAKKKLFSDSGGFTFVGKTYPSTVIIETDGRAVVIRWPELELASAESAPNL
ncbi:hypothetical protein EJ110_NYTH48480 [Nymphaea thermarum]|nr:hypothetical protein EJ110_NYTH48480 [Nymphaea thermarum]